MTVQKSNIVTSFKNWGREFLIKFSFILNDWPPPNILTNLMRIKSETKLHGYGNRLPVVLFHKDKLIIRTDFKSINLHEFVNIDLELARDYQIEIEQKLSEDKIVCTVKSNNQIIDSLTVEEIKAVNFETVDVFISDNIQTSFGSYGRLHYVHIINKNFIGE